MSPFRFQQCFGPFIMLLVKGSTEKRLLDNYVTAFIGDLNFLNTSGMSVIFFFENAQNLN